MASIDSHHDLISPACIEKQGAVMRLTAYLSDNDVTLGMVMTRFLMHMQVG